MSSAFERFFNKSLPDLRYFTANEFLAKGSNANGLNTDPPKELWPNVIPLARAMDAIRHHLGVPIQLHSVYRSLPYNRSIGSSDDSQHPKFTAADWSCPARGTPADWAATVKWLRAHGVFDGGVGLYKSFVHVDVRGTHANWLGRGAVENGEVLSPAISPTPIAIPSSPDFPPDIPTDDRTGSDVPPPVQDVGGNAARLLVGLIAGAALWAARKPIKGLFGWLVKGTPMQKIISAALLLFAVAAIAYALFGDF